MFHSKSSHSRGLLVSPSQPIGERPLRDWHHEWSAESSDCVRFTYTRSCPLDARPCGPRTLNHGGYSRTGQSNEALRRPGRHSLHNRALVQRCSGMLQRGPVSSHTTHLLPPSTPWRARMFYSPSDHTRWAAVALSQRPVYHSLHGRHHDSQPENSVFFSFTHIWSCPPVLHSFRQRSLSHGASTRSELSNEPLL